MMSDIDNMTESQISDEIKALVDVQRVGAMTPAQARRLERLRDGVRTIRGSKKVMWW
jgi:hypothetical protein